MIKEKTRYREDSFNHWLCYGCQHPDKKPGRVKLMHLYETHLCTDCMNAFVLACMSSQEVNGYILAQRKHSADLKSEDIDAKSAIANMIEGQKIAFEWCASWLRSQQEANGVQQEMEIST